LLARPRARRRRSPLWLCLSRRWTQAAASEEEAEVLTTAVKPHDGQNWKLIADNGQGKAQQRQRCSC
jgi:hypothetical protein